MDTIYLIEEFQATFAAMIRGEFPEAADLIEEAQREITGATSAEDFDSQVFRFFRLCEERLGLSSGSIVSAYRRYIY